MPFPEAPRAIYKRNVLDRVICQLTFPAILRIDTEVPSVFQEAIRHKFPMFIESHEGANFQLPESITEIMPHDILESLSKRSNLRFQFLSSDRAWTVSLTRDFIALVTTRYTCWEDFSENMELIVQALINVYAPAFFTRVGLRYQNVIDRTALNLKNRQWQDLIARYVLGPLADDKVADAIADHHNVTAFKLNNEGDLVRLQHGLVTEHSKDSSEDLYLLDIDLYCEKETEANAHKIATKLNDYNAANRRLFNWCIRDELRIAMEAEN